MIIIFVYVFSLSPLYFSFRLNLQTWLTQNLDHNDKQFYIIGRMEFVLPRKYKDPPSYYST